VSWHTAHSAFLDLSERPNKAYLAMHVIETGDAAVLSVLELSVITNETHLQCIRIGSGTLTGDT
jgi:hypothetical protein